MLHGGRPSFESSYANVYGRGIMPERRCVRETAGVMLSVVPLSVLTVSMSAAVLECVPLHPVLLASLKQRLGDRLSTSAEIGRAHV